MSLVFEARVLECTGVPLDEIPYADASELGDFHILCHDRASNTYVVFAGYPETDEDGVEHWPRSALRRIVVPRGGARPGAGRPRLFAEPVRRSVTMDESHWEAVRLLARATGSTPSLVLAALVEQATAEAARAVEESRCSSAERVVGPDGWEVTEQGYAMQIGEALLLVGQSSRDSTVFFWEVNFSQPERLKRGRAPSYEAAKVRALRAHDVALGLKPR